MFICELVVYCLVRVISFVVCLCAFHGVVYMRYYDVCVLCVVVHVKLVDILILAQCESVMFLLCVVCCVVLYCLRCVLMFSACTVLMVMNVVYVPITSMSMTYYCLVV